MDSRIRVTANPRLKSMTEMYKLDAREMRGIMVSIDSRFIKNEKRLFASEGASGGPKWLPLSPRYAKQKERQRKFFARRKFLTPSMARGFFTGRKIMQRTGSLRRSLVTKGSGHVATFSTVPTPRVSVGTSNIVAAYHAPKSIPGSLKNPRLPDRDVLQQSAANEREYRRVYVDHFIEKQKRILRTKLAAWRRAR